MSTNILLIKMADQAGTSGASPQQKVSDGFVTPKTKSRKRKQPDMDTSDISNPSEKRPHFKPLKAVTGSVSIEQSSSEWDHWEWEIWN